MRMMAPAKVRARMSSVLSSPNRKEIIHFTRNILHFIQTKTLRQCNKQYGLIFEARVLDVLDSEYR
jgi:transposase-like protein